MTDWFAWVGVSGMGWGLALVMGRSLHRFSARRRMMVRGWANLRFMAFSWVWIWRMVMVGSGLGWGRILGC